MSETYRKELSKTFPLGAIARPLILIISFYKVLKGKSKRLQSFRLSAFEECKGIQKNGFQSEQNYFSVPFHRENP